MVFKKSEYQNQFKSSQLVKNQSEYLENLTFRHKRRDREFIHTPIGWHAQENDEASSSEEETNENVNNNSVTCKLEKKNDEPQYQSLAEIIDESKAKSIAFRQRKREDEFSTDSQIVPDIAKISLDDDDQNLLKKYSSGICHDVEKNERAKESSCDKKSHEDAFENENASGNTDKKLRARSNMRRKKGSTKRTSESQIVSDHIEEPDESYNKHERVSRQVPSLPIGTRPRRPDRQKRIPSAKCRPVSQDRPPFVAYGAGDKENTFTTHRTHNVRSTVDVYGPALKAKIRREEEKKRQMERQKRMTQSTNDLLEKLASATPRDMVDWRSEYQKQFHGYEPQVYERSSSSRAVISHSAPIRAVHRGGSLIVHVD